MKRLLLFSSLSFLIVCILISCQKEVSFETDQDLALGSLHDSTDECYPISVAGTYYNGINAARDTNTVMLYVNVTQAGSYTISSSSENGFSFSDTGFFSTVGLDSIRLQASGTPILIKPTDFTVSFNQTSCSFTVNVLDSTGTGLSGSDPVTGGGDTTTGSYYVDPNPALANSWKFTDSSNTVSYSGAVGAASITSGSGLNVFTVSGFPANNHQFSVILNLPTASISTGIYKLSQASIGAVSYVNTSTVTYDYNADGNTTMDATDSSYINVTNYNTSTKQVQASFRCWAAKDGATDPVLIKGSFNAVIQ